MRRRPPRADGDANATTRSHRPTRTRGFTLLEVLVALTIVAVALTATMRAMGSMTTASDSLQTRMIATWSAENHLANLRLARVFPDPG
ncbi:type II secretion system protein GspI, partial [Bacillus pumilus]